MMELVDMRDLGSREAIRVGSSPTTRTKTKAPAFAGAFVLAISSFQCSKVLNTYAASTVIHRYFHSWLRIRIITKSLYSLL